MITRRDSWAVLGCGALVVGTLLACKKDKEDPTPDPGAVPAPTPAATTPKPAATTPTKIFNVGDEAVAPDYKLKVSNVKECKPKYSFNRTKLKKADRILMGVEVMISSTSDKTFSVSSYHAKVTDKEGLTFKNSYMTSNCDPKLETITLNKGEKAKGWVVFEIPKDASGLKFQYEYKPILAPPQILKFDMGR